MYIASNERPFAFCNQTASRQWCSGVGVHPISVNCKVGWLAGASVSTHIFSTLLVRYHFEQNVSGESTQFFYSLHFPAISAQYVPMFSPVYFRKHPPTISAIRSPKKRMCSGKGKVRAEITGVGKRGQEAYRKSFWGGFPSSSDSFLLCRPDSLSA